MLMLVALSLLVAWAVIEVKKLNEEVHTPEQQSRYRKSVGY